MGRAISRLRKNPPRPASSYLLPKRDGLTRPAHILSVVERVYYQALVDTFLHDVDARLEDAHHVFGYRARGRRNSPEPFGHSPIGQWLDFSQAVKGAARASGVGAVVITDVAAFFERIGHGPLRDRLTSVGVSAASAAELYDLLKALVGKRRGLPQGYDASSVLATAFLDPVDKAMLRKGWAYYRYVDDIRIVAPSEAHARKALRDLEAEMRKIDLNLQPGKTKILVGTAQIKAEILEADAEIAAVDYVVTAIRTGSRGAVRKAWRSASRRKPIPPRLVKYLLNRLRGNRDVYGVGWCKSHLGTVDWLADIVGPYLAQFASRSDIQVAIENHLRSPMNLSAWEECNLFRSLLSARHVRRGILNHACDRLDDRSAETPSRQWAAVLLGRHGDPSDQSLVVAHSLDNSALARASVIALQSSSPATRRSHYRAIAASFPEHRWLTERVRGLAAPHWPLFR